MDGFSRYNQLRCTLTMRSIHPSGHH